jgi:hypothetical protein
MPMDDFAREAVGGITTYITKPPSTTHTWLGEISSKEHGVNCRAYIS